jgi:hypothetical protein
MALRLFCWLLRLHTGWLMVCVRVIVFENRALVLWWFVDIVIQRDVETNKGINAITRGIYYLSLLCSDI